MHTHTHTHTHPGADRLPVKRWWYGEFDILRWFEGFLGEKVMFLARRAGPSQGTEGRVL